MADDNIHIAERKVTTVSPRDTTEITLRVIDWRRIYRKVKSINPALSWRELFAGVSWGITASAFLSLIPLYQSTQSTEAWVKPTFWIVSIASLVIGLVIWFGGTKEASNADSSKSEILQDMKEIHCIYFEGDDLDKD